MGRNFGVSHRPFIDRAAAPAVHDRTAVAANQIPEEATSRRRAYFSAIYLTKETPARRLATDREA